MATPVEPVSRRVFGVSVRSEIPLPGAAVDDPPEALISFGTVPATVENPLSEGVCFAARPDALVLNVDGVARYVVEDGTRITIERAEGSADDEVRLFLLSSAFGALLHQRGVLPLMGAAVVADGEAVVFAGPPAIGASTLAARFLDVGRALLSDDLCAVSLDSAGGPVVHPGLPQLKLWSNALRALGWDPGALRPVRPGMEKFVVPVDERFHAEPARLCVIYILEETTDSRFALERVAGLDATIAINRIAYRSAFVGGPFPPTPSDLRTEPWASHVKRVTAIAAQCQVTAVTRPTRGFRLEELAELVDADLRNGRRDP